MINSDALSSLLSNLLDKGNITYYLNPTQKGLGGWVAGATVYKLQRRRLLLQSFSGQECLLHKDLVRQFL